MKPALTVLLLLGMMAAVSRTQPPIHRQPQTSPAKPAAPSLSDEEKVPPSPLARFMRKKLGASNLILEGLCVDNMAKIEKGVGQLLDMSDEERWRVSNDVLYLNHSREFRRAVLNLKEKAAASSSDGVALAWIDVTMNCIRCHSWVRDTIIVGQDERPLPPLSAERLQP
ncbi:MAG: hypothetical protein NXI04_21545 [Planctomycetaceae bacterium]|nr:hypothetical protein [Planctomycetaceae bacterium]